MRRGLAEDILDPELGFRGSLGPSPEGRDPRCCFGVRGGVRDKAALALAWDEWEQHAQRRTSRSLTPAIAVVGVRAGSARAGRPLRAFGSADREARFQRQATLSSVR